MKHDKKCARCDGSTFYCVDTAQSPNYEFANSFEPLGIAGEYGETGQKGMFGGAKQGRRVVMLEAWVCKGCGFTDFYAKDLELLEQLASKRDGVRRIG